MPDCCRTAAWSGVHSVWSGRMASAPPALAISLLMWLPFGCRGAEAAAPHGGCWGGSSAGRGAGGRCALRPVWWSGGDGGRFGLDGLPLLGLLVVGDVRVVVDAEADPGSPG